MNGDDLVWLSDTVSSTMASAHAARIKECAGGARATFQSVRGGRKSFYAQRKSESCTDDASNRFEVQGQTVPRAGAV